MIILFLSIVGVVVGVLATGASISDGEALMLIGITIIGGAILLRRKMGRRD